MFMEYCADGDMNMLLKSRNGKLTVIFFIIKIYNQEEEAVMYFRQLCEAFRELYAHNIIHRDIKPANILLHEGKCKLGDFGFAKTIIDDNSLAHTYLGIYNLKIFFFKLGTPLYMPP